jgi:cbb3-type cytochrome oxidase maturation protein
MTVLYVFLAIAVAIFVSGVIALIWSIRTGQYDDLDTPSLRMLGDDVPNTSSRQPHPESGN